MVIDKITNYENLFSNQDFLMLTINQEKIDKYIEKKQEQIIEKNLLEWIKGKYIAECGDVACCYDNKYEAICRLALELQKDRVRYYKELEDRGFRK